MAKLVELKKKIKTNKAKIGIVGLGYVGLPLAIEFAKAGFSVTGIDIDEHRVKQVNSGKSYITDIKDSDIKSILHKKRFHAVADFSVVKDLDAIIICVPTPLRKTKEPDISFIIDASEKVSKYLNKGSLVILQSTTYPGTTEEKLLQIFQKRGRKIDRDFYLAFSPERVDPGNSRFTTANTPKIIGGLSKSSSEAARVLYETIIDVVVVVSSARTAEVVKLLENSFRSVNIALVNELAIICNKLNIDVWEVIEAAKTKPFGFMPFYPGPGLGGHCIPVDPLYLTWKARLEGLEPRFIELASQVNSYMPQYIVERLDEIYRMVPFRPFEEPFGLPVNRTYHGPGHAGR